jgi:hypothetical protein
MSRAAAFAFGATITFSACSASHYGGPPDIDVVTAPDDASGDVTDGGNTPADAVADVAPDNAVPTDIAAMYGTPPPPPDAAADVVDATPADSGNGGVRYGAPSPPDWC